MFEKSYSFGKIMASKKSDVPSGFVNNAILLSFVVWCLFSFVIHYWTCRVQRYAIPSFESVLHQSIDFEIAISLHCVSKNTKKCLEISQSIATKMKSKYYKNDDLFAYHASIKEISTHFHSKNGQECKYSVFNHSFIKCLSIFNKNITDFNLNDYHFFIIDESEIHDSNFHWIVSPYRTFWTSNLDFKNTASLGL